MSILVTNDFPPKRGGIQTYLFELWRRLPDTVVITASPKSNSEELAWDKEQTFRIERINKKVLLPSRSLAKRIDAVAREISAPMIFIDPMLPLGLIGSRLREAPHVIVAHGAEVTFYGRVPGSKILAKKVLRSAKGVVAAGNYPAEMARKVARTDLPILEVPPGVDVDRFTPLSADARRVARMRFGLDPDAPLVLGLSRLVPRKGFDVVIDAVKKLEGVHLAIAGTGRDRARLEKRAESLGKRVHFLDEIADDDLPLIHGSADVFAMACRDRWGGLEAEGFGIVFLEAGSCAVPAVAGWSGGAHEAVADGESGFVVDPHSVSEVSGAIDRLIGNPDLRHLMGQAARARAKAMFSYEHLAQRLSPLAAGDTSGLSRSRD